MKKPIFGCLAAIVALLVFLAVSGGFYTVSETEQVVVTQFGEAVGDPVVTPGLKFKIPILQKATYFDRRILEWDGRATEMPTRDKTYIMVDAYARWRIEDPLLYFQALRDERSALSRLDDILGSEIRNMIARHELIEVVRTTRDRTPMVEEELAEADLTGSIGRLTPIRRGRGALEKEIFETAEGKLKEFGIVLLDVRFKRINYNQDVQERIYERMISERQQIAERFRSEGAGEAAKILGDMERDLLTIQSEAYRTVQETRGEADAKATEIYAAAFDQSEESAEFYEFLRTLEIYGDILDDSTVVLTTDSDLFKYLKAVKPSEVGAATAAASATNAVPAPAPTAPAPAAPAPTTPAPAAPAPATPAPSAPAPSAPAPSTPAPATPPATSPADPAVPTPGAP